MKNFLIFIFALYVLPTFACDDWFNGLKIKDTENCEPKCRIAETDMSSYMCKQQCDVLCKKIISEPVKDDNFYGLTDDELKYCKSNKITCAKAYKLSWDAEGLCLTIYKRSDTDDGSDACRHFVWAFMLTRDFGSKDAEAILSAHENNPKQSDADRAMDLANNRLGQIEWQNSKDKKLSDKELISLFKEKLKNKKLVILKPRQLSNGGVP